jgi:predicted 3-demethylubiquinone-9 3-methyltransferase (glyoxalase superfamily)
MPEIRTCLWFEADAEAAVAFYTGLLPGSETRSISRPAPDAPAVLVQLTLAGTPYTALQGGPGPTHSPAMSIAAELDTQAEADRVYDAILARGGVEDRCGWVTDPWGISWQIIPKGLHAASFGDDIAANGRAYAAMLGMKKLNVAALVRARANPEKETT